MKNHVLSEFQPAPLFDPVKNLKWEDAIPSLMVTNEEIKARSFFVVNLTKQSFQM